MSIPLRPASFSHLPAHVKRLRRLSPLLGSIAATLALAFPGRAAVVVSTWNAGNGDWEVAGNWTNVPALGSFPHNGNAGVLTYDAELSNGATITLNQAIVIERFTLSNGTLNGGSSLTLNDNLSWTGGTMSGGATTSVAGTASTISGGDQKFLGRTLVNTGTLTFSHGDNSAPLYFGSDPVSPGVLTNNGTFNVTAGGDFAQNYAPGGQAINNAGTWNVSGAGTVSNIFGGIAFHNTGAVNVNSGAFVAGGGDSGNTTGAFNVAAGADLAFGGDFTLAAASSISGAGTMNFFSGTSTIGGTYNITGTSYFSGGSVTFNSPVTSLGSGPLTVTGGAVYFNSTTPTLPGIILSGGTLGGTAPVSVTGALEWTGGTMSGSGTTSVAGSTSTISGGDQKILGRTLVNTGTITFSHGDNSAPLYFGSDPVSPGVLTNNGTFNVTAGGDFAQNFSPSGQAINNAGTWNVSGAGTVSNIFGGIAFHNTGAVNVNSGAFVAGGGDSGNTTGAFNVAAGADLAFGGDFTMAAASSISGAGTMNFFNGTSTINGTYNITGTTYFTGATVNFNSPIASLGVGPLTISSGAVYFNSNDISVSAIDLSGGLLGGTVANVNTTGALTWTGGTMTGSGTTTVSGAASTISGNNGKYLGRLLVNNGTIAFDTGDNTAPLYFGPDPVSPGVLTNNGTFNVTAGGDFSQNYFIPGQAINNTGTWNVSGAGTVSNISGALAFHNTGAVNVLSGGFIVGGGDSGNTTGAFNVAAGADLAFGGDFTMSAASSISGAGTMNFFNGTSTIGGTYNITGTSYFSGATVNFNAPITSLGVGPLTISSGAVYFNSTTPTLPGIILSGGTLGGTAPVSATGDLTWTGGTMNGTGTTAVAGLTSTIDGNNGKFLGRTLVNTGTMTFGTGDNTAPLYFGSDPVSPGVLTNNGTFNVTAGGDFAQNYAPSGQAINNAGTWNVSGAGTVSNISGNVAFHNTGTVNVLSGGFIVGGGDSGNTTGAFNVAAGADLAFGGGDFTLAATSSISGAGTMNFFSGTSSINGSYNITGTTLISGGTANFNASANASLLNFSSGTLGGSGTVHVGTMSWTGGTMTGAGTTSVELLISTISGDNFKALGRTLENNARMDFTTSDNTAPLYFGPDPSSPGVFTNNGSFNVTAGGDFSQYYSLAGQVINNTESWNVSGAGTVSNVGAGIAFNNTGTVNVFSGEFALGGGDTGSTTGLFFVMPDGLLSFRGGNFTLAPVSSLSSAGSVIFAGGTTDIGGAYFSTNTQVSGGAVNFNAPAGTSLLELVGGTVGGSGILNATDLTWTSGVMSGTGTTNLSGIGTISGDAGKYLGRTLVNTGTTTFSTSDNTAPLYFGPDPVSPGMLTNNGTFNVTAGGDFAQYYFVAGQAINNAGIWNVSGAGTTSQISGGVAFNNTGTVNITSGAMGIGGGGLSTGTFATSAGANLQFTGGVSILANGVSFTGAGQVTVAGGAVTAGSVAADVITAANFGVSSGTLDGAGVFNVTNLSWTGGAMSGSGTTNVAGTGTISEDSQKFLGRALVNNGTMTFSTSDLTQPLYFGPEPAAPGVLTNNGTFNVTAGGDFATYYNPGGQAINNTGIWNVSGAGTTSNVNSNVAFNNTGTVNVISGTMAIGGGGTSTGTFATASGASLQFSGSNSVLGNGASLTGAGPATVIGGTVTAGSVATDVITATNFGVSGGTIDGVGNFNIDNFSWTSGSMVGSGITNVAGTGTISDDGQKFLGRTLVNNGTMTFSTGDLSQPLYFGADTNLPGVFTNNGTFNVTAGGDLGNYYNPLGQAINNTGTWNVSGVGTSSQITGNLTFSNTGTVNVTSGTFDLTSTTVAQYAGDTLSAGKWSVGAGAALRLPVAGSGIVTNQAEITLTGAGSVLRAGDVLATLESTLSTNEGKLRILGGRNFIATNALTNSGQLQLGGGILIAPSLTNTATGEISGTGVIGNPVSNNGTISPGFSAGRLDITADLTLGSLSVLSFQIGGLAQGTQYDFLTEMGSSILTLEGNLAVSFIDSFQNLILPTDTFTIITSNQPVTGHFANVVDGRIGTTNVLGTFAVSFSGNSVVLSDFEPVPEPGTALFGLACLGIAAGRRRRRRPGQTAR